MAGLEAQPAGCCTPLGKGMEIRCLYLGPRSLPPVRFPAYAGSGEVGFAAACSLSARRRALWSVAAAGSSEVPSSAADLPPPLASWLLLSAVLCPLWGCAAGKTSPRNVLAPGAVLNEPPGRVGLDRAKQEGNHLFAPRPPKTIDRCACPGLEISLAM